MNHSKEQKVDRAAQEFGALIDLHNHFVDIITTPEMSHGYNDIGNLTKKDKCFEAQCLGCTLKVKFRPIIVDSDIPTAIEYAFIFEDEDEKKTIFVMYLGRDGSLWKDPNEKNRICDHGGRYVVKHVLYELADSLIDSKLFRISE